MSELINKNDNGATIRWKLLTGASALALTVAVSSASIARAEDTGQPQIWIELGGQLSGLSDGQETFAPVFPNSPARPSIFAPSQKFEKPPRFSLDEEGKISFQPENSDWVFSAAIRYGRSASSRHVVQQTSPKAFVKYYYNSFGDFVHNTNHPGAEKFADTLARTSEHHLILDFQTGRDVGLGMFGGGDGSSVVNLGVRFAQFASKSNIALKSNPDWHFHYKYLPILLSFGHTSSKFVGGSIYHSNSANLQAARSFRGVGPSLSWNASAPFAGNSQDGELAFDWDINAAFLFGRQRSRTHHQTTGRYHGAKYGSAVRHITFQHPATPDHTRSRNVTVPNIGGSVGLSWRLQDFKVSFGYKADFFFGAIDGGIDARKDENRGFFGPFASISVGIGD